MSTLPFAELSRTACFNGERKRPAASAPSAAKRVRLSPEDCSRSVDRTDLNSNHNNSQLLSKICISSVAGDVPMSPVSPQSSGECAPLSPPVQPQLQQTAQKPPCSEPPAQRIQPVQSCPQQATLIQRQKQLPVHLPHQTTAVHPNQAFTVSPANHPILNHHVQWMQHGPLEQQRLTHMPQFNNVPQPHRMIPPGPPQMIPPGPHQIIPPGPHQIVFRQQVPVRHPIPLYPPIYHHRFNQEQLYQMQVEQQMRTTIQMSHSPHFTPQMPPPPPPPPPPPTHIPARPATQAPPVHGGDCSHTIQRVDQLHPSAPPVLLKVLSPDNTANPTEQSSTVEPTVAKITAVTLNTTLQQQQLVQKRPMSECPVSVVEHLPQQQTLCHVPPLHFPQLSRSQLVAAPQSHTIISPNQLDARITISTENQEAVAVEDSDSEDEHALHIDEGEMSRSPPSPQPPASPEIHSPVEDTVEKERPAKLDLQTQPDDGYCSTTASTLDSADDVKHVLPFANFGDFIPLHSCSDEDRREEDKELEPENNDLGKLLDQISANWVI